jgi:ABC-type dipeptide/oligopeptide/nickel transport system ATPase component
MTTHAPSEESDAILNVQNLSVTFRQSGRETRAVQDVSFSIRRGETVALIGESGSGKSVTALSLTRLLPEPPANFDSGKIFFEGRDILLMSKAGLQKIRGSGIAYIFQEPGAALNPVFTIGYQIGEAVHLHQPHISDVRSEIVRLLDLVGIQYPQLRMNDYPHQLSGGMQQRVMIAMALACQPQLLVADEPTTALDVTIQKQVIDLMRKLKEELRMTTLLITHNFGIVHGFAERVIVMLRGKIVEEGPTEKILRSPQHPYTRALIDCVPRLGRKARRLTTIEHEKIASA